MRYLILLTCALAFTGCSGVQGILFDLAVAEERVQSGLEARTVVVEGVRTPYLERKGAREGLAR